MRRRRSPPADHRGKPDAATAVVTMIYNILVIGCNTVQQTTFSTKSVNIRSFQKQPTRRKAA